MYAMVALQQGKQLRLPFGTLGTGCTDSRCNAVRRALSKLLGSATEQPAFYNPYNLPFIDERDVSALFR